MKNKKRKYAWRRRIAKQESYEVHIENGMKFIECDDNADNPEEEVIRSELIKFVRSQVRELPEKYRMVVYLYYTADMKIKDIASLYKIPESTIKSRLVKAKKILKQKLEEEL